MPDESNAGQQAAQTPAPTGGVDAATLQEIRELRKELQNAKEEGDKAKMYLSQVLEMIPQQGEQQEARSQDTEEEALERFKEAFEKNPKKALDEHFSSRVRPLVQSQYEQSVVREYESAKMKHPQLFEKYGEEIVRFMEPMALDTKATPGAWEKAAQFVRMQHIDDEISSRVEEKVSELKSHFTETGAIELPSSDNGTIASGAPKITAIERDIAKKFGMSSDEWRKYSVEEAATAGAGEEGASSDGD